jgi:hypothetical protein
MDVLEQKLQIPAEAFAKAREMLNLMNADLEEVEIAAQVRAFDGGDSELQLQTWECLTTKERAAWRAFFAMGRT